MTPPLRRIKSGSRNYDTLPVGVLFFLTDSRQYVIRPNYTCGHHYPECSQNRVDGEAWRDGGAERVCPTCASEARRA